ncbi:methylthioadenosine phosphorylase [Branchiibius hedensis]|uniref:Purine nucleoside phosphorylase n=1 Tax=Branchiibius hedensis TaxID=672460 RepID=A0A2Y8ZTI0_9MICO|nr:S-methyl-5'-thioadenosine phosphorylase [Branchiibius hedensis]PWJ26383.1 methylthioadenosine phosphorylase [Branchiibius hedensis]SSA35195.1 methylthioadenosine phosphorylase [Branchiibius hedensis]
MSSESLVGIIGGSGLYSFFADDAPRRTVDTPFGAPSDDIVLGEIGGRQVAFLPRHGRGHRYPPHRINYRANLWALRSLGVRQVLAPSAVGSLQRQLGPGTFVVPDQVVDRTWGRAHTVYDDPGPVVHVAFADPYCPLGRTALLQGAEGVPNPCVDGGTLVVINGPRFSSRAESRWHQQAGWSVVGMTGMPEASIARELALCYSAICLVTDLDAGLEQDQGVTHQEVMAAFERNLEQVRAIISAAVPALPTTESPSCSCRQALDGLTLPFDLP